MEIQRINGSLIGNNEIQDILKELNKPAVFTNMIADWPTSKWSLQEFTHLFGHLVTTFKLYYKDSVKSEKYQAVNKKRKLDENATTEKMIPVMETDCFYVSASFKEFFAWVNKLDENLGELQKYP